MNLTKWMWMLGAVGTMGLVGCGVSNQSGAVSAATKSACKYYDRCGQIGPGETYSNAEDCEIRQRAFWNNQWQVSDCDDRINPDNFDYCLKSIEATSCSSALDNFVTTYDKCSKKNVCSGN